MEDIKNTQALEPCPFCGGEAKEDACDRLISIGCARCGYKRNLPGLLQTTRNDKPILQYRNDDGSIRQIAPEEAKEFYHSDAHERATEEWNKCASPPAAPVDAQRVRDEAEHKLRAASDSAYCQYIRQMQRDECLGWEAKVKSGKFSEDELKAHTRAGEYLGEHRALLRVISIVADALQSQSLPSTETDAETLKAIRDAAVDDLTKTSDDDLRKEIAEDGQDIYAVAAKVKEGLLDTCMSSHGPAGCYRVRCQLGKVCIAQKESGHD